MKKLSKKERARIDEIIRRLIERYGGESRTYLLHENAWQLLFATILSAQCTDDRVNMVTRDLFKKYKTLEDFAGADLKEMEDDIHSTGFYHNKAKNIKKCSQQLLELYGGEVPQDMDKLVNLAGVGRKTANVVRGEIWGLADGITVDTHVRRLSNLIGFVQEEDPIKIERELMKIVPKKSWIDFSHYLILQGRDTCIARRPRCNQCEISEFCKGKKIIDK